MLAPALPLALLLLQAAPQSGPARSWILTCDVASNPSQPAVRVFRQAPGQFQEWSTENQAFGPNLCLSFSCRADRSRLEGTIQGATLIFTVTLKPSGRSAVWRSVGATGLSRTTGSCLARSEEPGRAVASGGP